MENQIINSEEKTLSESMIQNIKETAPWMKFLAIMSFIGAGLIFIVSIYLLSKSSEMKYAYYYGDSYEDPTIAAICFIVAAIIMCVLGAYVYKSAKGYSEFCTSSDVNSLETAFLMQKKYWKAVGILTIIYISLVIVLSILSASSNSFY
jgi:hypothetical protein